MICIKLFINKLLSSLCEDMSTISIILLTTNKIIFESRDLVCKSKELITSEREVSYKIMDIFSVERDIK